MSFPVEINHFPECANFSDNTQLSCKFNWYLSDLLICNTSTWLLSIPTANQSPVGQYPKEKICEEKSYWLNWRPSLKSHVLTVLSKPPVNILVPSGEISMQLAPSVCPWNCLWKDTIVSKNLTFSLKIYLTKVWLCTSHTAILPSEQQLKHTFESGDIAKA